MVNQQVMKQIENLEDELQALKLSYMIPAALSLHSLSVKNVVKDTAGLLRKDFPSGLVYTRNIRKDWPRRAKKLGL